MDIVVPLLGKTRVVPVRFVRAGGGFNEIDPSLPDIDNRGHRGPSNTAHVGVAVGNTVRIGVERVGVPLNLPLFAVASNDSFTVEGNAQLGSVPEPTVQIRGVDGRSESRIGHLEIHAQSAGGPLVGRLRVEVFMVRPVNLTFHRVTLVTGGVPAPAPAMNFNTLAQVAHDVWIHYGIDLHWTERADQVQVANAGVVDLPDFAPLPEIRRTYNTNPVRRTVNVYVVPRIQSHIPNARINAFGVPRSKIAAFQLDRPGLLLEDLAAGDPVEPAGNILAHELGHFFHLEHVNIRQAPRMDATSYALRNVMHNMGPSLDMNGWVPDQFSHTCPRSNEHGYGTQRRGALVTMKGITGIRNDNQIHLVRSVLASAHGPY
jgi:hypothetical protein